ncbi:hypothetical protein BKA62DRAFT_740295 [Auriculariales sp. MPI-PUGE-AT-0066]|nr:hypothetical protein BKA62DRAFT_740295 [Auriculariales sp. MPI-PUGE-AT-0066]
MFKKFSPSSDIAGQTPVKSSVQRAIRAQLLGSLKIDAETLEQIWPKKENLVHVKCREHMSIYTLNGVPLFFQHFDEQIIPTLRLIHSYPDMLPRVQVDRGAIRYLLAGANMMCPGFTSAGGALPSAEAAAPAGSLVAIHCEGKEHAAAVGILKLSTEEIKTTTKGVAVEIASYLGDDLYQVQKI